jgi:dTDP-4-dehydrorhamnose 3,5-epimerase
MIFTETPLQGAWIIDPEPAADERGLFARVWCAREFAAQGLETGIAQVSVSFNPHQGTLRGLHYQAEPHGEVKLVRCSGGAIFDVIVDLREDSSTFASHYSVVLTAANRRLLYVPRGCAHGFQTLEPNTEVTYQISEFYMPGHGRGVRWDDPAFGIAWPAAEWRIMTDRDRTYPDFRRAARREF